LIVKLHITEELCKTEVLTGNFTSTAGSFDILMRKKFSNFEISVLLGSNPHSEQEFGNSTISLLKKTILDFYEALYLLYSFIVVGDQLRKAVCSTVF
jgi:hypothetical protein